MSLFSGLFLVLLGILAAPHLVTARAPGAQGPLDSLVPYRGWIGLFGIVWGLLTVLWCLTYIRWIWWGGWLTLWISSLVGALVLVVLGYLLAAPLIRELAFRSAETLPAPMEQTRAALAPFQSVLAILAVLLGLWVILLQLIYALP